MKLGSSFLCTHPPHLSHKVTHALFHTHTHFRTHLHPPSPLPSLPHLFFCAPPLLLFLVLSFLFLFPRSKGSSDVLDDTLGYSRATHAADVSPTHLILGGKSICLKISCVCVCVCVCVCACAFVRVRVRVRVRVCV